MPDYVGEDRARRYARELGLAWEPTMNNNAEPGVVVTYKDLAKLYEREGELIEQARLAEQKLAHARQHGWD